MDIYFAFTLAGNADYLSGQTALEDFEMSEKVKEKPHAKS